MSLRKKSLIHGRVCPTHRGESIIANQVIFHKKISAWGKYLKIKSGWIYNE